MPEGVDVIVEPDSRAGGASPTALFAAAALDPHDVPVESLSIGTLETELYGAGQGRGATAAVTAGPTAARPVQLCCGASGKGESYCFLRPHCSLTLLSSLKSRKIAINSKQY